MSVLTPSLTPSLGLEMLLPLLVTSPSKPTLFGMQLVLLL
jgi:hypothetical protein